MGQCAAVITRQSGKKDVDGEEPASSKAATPLPIHTRSFLKDYEVCRQVLGSGASGVVRVVKRKTTGEKFALKVLRDCPVARREVQLQHLCRHTNIVRIVDVYENIHNELRCLFVIMELMEGGPLFDRIRRGRLTEREVACIVRTIGCAIAHMHSLNVAHRDLKPENMLYTKNGVLKLADFGFAKQCSEDCLQTACFTNYYVPPEILRRASYDKSCDMWSLGVVMYILLCGFPPFFSEGDKDFSAGMRNRIRTGAYNFPSPEWDAVSDDAKALVKKLLVTDPPKRLTIDEMMADNWIVRCSLAPKTPLFTPNINDQILEDIHETMGKELTGMRIMYGEIVIKPLNESNNKILTRRKLTAQNALSPVVESSGSLGSRE